MEKIKEYYNAHKIYFYAVGGVVLAAVAYFLMRKK